jgi:hypothetical protein
MDDIHWLHSIPFVVFVTLGLLAVRSVRKSRLGKTLQSVRCPNCVTPISARRCRMFRSPLLWGGWMCPHCGTRMDRSGRNVSGTAS